MYKMTASFDTDDDAKLSYQDQDYCFYGDDLKIFFEAPTIKECKEHLRTITITPGFKCSESITKMLADFIQSDELSTYMSGNQDIRIFISEVEASDKEWQVRWKTKYLLDELEIPISGVMSVTLTGNAVTILTTRPGLLIGWHGTVIDKLTAYLKANVDEKLTIKLMEHDPWKE